MKSRIKFGKYLSFGKYSKNIFKNSLITSFPEIATSKSCTKRLIKILVFIFSVIGFIYQTLDFLGMYFSYSTVVNVRITYPFEIEQPALTICNTNKRRRTFVCTRKNNNCIYIDPFPFCLMYRAFCPDEKTDFPYLPNQETRFEYSFDWDNSAQEAHNESTIGDCIKDMEGKRHKCELPYKKVPVVTTSGEPNFCYTVGSQWGNPNAKPNMYPNTFRFELDIRIQPEEYIYFFDPSLVRIAVHDRKALANPYTDGYDLKGGVLYNAYVSMTTRERLSYPYDTNCTDYLEVWKKNNGTGPLNDVTCIEHCKLNKLLELGLCIDKNVDYSHMEKLCPRLNTSLTRDITRDCIIQCQNPCRDQKYEVRYEEAASLGHMCGDLDRWCQIERTKVNLIFNKFRHTEYFYQPKFESVELFSYVGSYMGMWLGLSIVAMFDLFETLSYLLFYPIGRIARAHRLKKKFTCKQREKNVTAY